MLAMALFWSVMTGYVTCKMKSLNACMSAGLGRTTNGCNDSQHPQRDVTGTSHRSLPSWTDLVPHPLSGNLAEAALSHIALLSWTTKSRRNENDYYGINARGNDLSLPPGLRRMGLERVNSTRREFSSGALFPRFSPICCLEQIRRFSLALDKTVLRRPCAEFPNDNPALYEVLQDLQDLQVLLSSCVDLGEAPTSDPASCNEHAEIPEQEDPLSLETSATVQGVPEPRSDPFASLVELLECVARSAGGTECAARATKGLLGLERFETATLPQLSVDALIAGTQLEQTPNGPRRTEAFTQTVRAWQGVLRGESEDFSMCGAATLDEWSADVLARVLGNAMLAPQLRRELRQRGVAAFGLVAEAA
jgi:hypothetical protein